MEWRQGCHSSKCRDGLPINRGARDAAPTCEWPGASPAIRLPPWSGNLPDTTCASSVSAGSRCALAVERSGLQPLVAFAVVAAALLDPPQPTVAARCLVGIVLVEAGVHARPAGLLARVLRRDRGREDRIARCGGGRRRRLCGRSGCRGRGGRSRGRGGGTAFRLAEVGPFPAVERAVGFG